MTFQRFISKYPVLKPQAMNCLAGDKGTRIQYRNYAFVNLGNKMLFSNLNDILKESPEIIVLGGLSADRSK